MHHRTFFNIFNLRCNEKSASVAVHDCKKKSEIKTVMSRQRKIVEGE